MFNRELKEQVEELDKWNKSLQEEIARLHAYINDPRGMQEVDITLYTVRFHASYLIQGQIKDIERAFEYETLERALLALNQLKLQGKIELPMREGTVKTDDLNVEGFFEVNVDWQPIFRDIWIETDVANVWKKPDIKD